MNKYAKAIVSLLTSAETVASLYPNVHWTQAVAAAIGTFLVFFVPNGTPPKGPEVPAP
jgi:hypothetical protein